MAVEIVEARQEWLPKIVEMMLSVGMDMNVPFLSHYFFEVPASESTAPVRGGLVVRDGADIVGFLGLAPCRLIGRGKSYDGYQMGVLGLQPGYGPYMFDLIDRVKELSANSFAIANTANEKSVKLWTQYGEFVPGPSGGELSHYDLFPLATLSLPRLRQPMDECADFNDPRLRNFWSSYVKETDGFALERTSARQQRLFGGRLERHESALLTVACGDEILGYAVIRARKRPRFPYLRYEVSDLIARKNDIDVLVRLLQKCRRYVARHGGVMLEYVGSNRGLEAALRACLPRTRIAPANTAYWYTQVPEIHAALANNDGWLFGPYDGDRCA